MRSRFGVVKAGPGPKEKSSAVGWEHNAQGKIGARMADLAPMMDPVRCVTRLQLPGA